MQVSKDCAAAMQTALSRAKRKQADAQSSLDKAAEGQSSPKEGPCGKHQVMQLIASIESHIAEHQPLLGSKTRGSYHACFAFLSLIF